MLDDPLWNLGRFEGVPVYTSEHLSRRVLRDDFSRWERFRLWFEKRADAAGLIWPWRRVTRTRTVEDHVLWMTSARMAQMLIVGPETNAALLEISRAQ